MDRMDMIVLVAGSLVSAAVIAMLWSWSVARPDEWLLQIRDGRMIRAGVGISIWRRPGDVLVRYSSAIQRATFSAIAPSRDQVPFAVEGFALWTVQSAGDGPFRAFRNLGLANLAERHPALRSDKHLLTAAQYRAFQKLLAAEVQQLASTLPAAELLSARPALVEALAERLEKIAETLGFRLEKIEIQQVQPAEKSLATDLAAEREQQIREDAARTRQESESRLASERQESESRLASERQARAHTLGLAEEASARALSVERSEREETEFAARLDRTRREAEARRDALVLVGEAEERKSQPVRDHELATLTAEKVASALTGMKETRWVSVGGETPMEGLAAMIAGVREIVANKH